MSICTDCGNILTDEEAHWYGYRCEECEVAWGVMIEKWRRGADFPELDALYDAPPPPQEPAHD